MRNSMLSCHPLPTLLVLSELMRSHLVGCLHPFWAGTSSVPLKPHLPSSPALLGCSLSTKVEPVRRVFLVLKLELPYVRPLPTRQPHACSGKLQEPFVSRLQWQITRAILLDKLEVNHGWYMLTSYSLRSVLINAAHPDGYIWPSTVKR
jgi:hypothetical protein